MRQKLEETKSKFQNNHSSNKVVLEEQLMIEKEQKFGSILSFALSVIGNVTSNRRALLASSAPGSSQFIHSENGGASKVSSNYFYFSGSQSGMIYNQSSLSRGQQST
jgi:hypothetical protein